MQDHRLGALVGAAEEELRFPPTVIHLIHTVRVRQAGRLKDIVDFRSQKFSLSWCCGP